MVSAFIPDGFRFTFDDDEERVAATLTPLPQPRSLDDVINSNFWISKTPPLTLNSIKLR